MLKQIIHIGTVSSVMFFASLSGLAQGPGADVYKAKCQMCHGVDGLGGTPAGKATKARPFNSPDVMKESEADLIAVTKAGKNKMPAYAGKLSDDQIKGTIEYIKTLQKK